MDSAKNESGANQNRLNIPNVYTAIWWYADYPNHYAGDGAKATTNWANWLMNIILIQFIAALKGN